MLKQSLKNVETILEICHVETIPEICENDPKIMVLWAINLMKVKIIY